jgi:hypothetical protein
MDEQQDRIVAVGAADIDHLAGAAEFGLERLLDAVGSDDMADVGDDRAAGSTRVCADRIAGRGGGRGKRQSGGGC